MIADYKPLTVTASVDLLNERRPKSLVAKADEVDIQVEYVIGPENKLMIRSDNKLVKVFYRDHLGAPPSRGYYVPSSNKWIMVIQKSSEDLTEAMKRVFARYNARFSYDDAKRKENGAIYDRLLATDMRNAQIETITQSRGSRDKGDHIMVAPSESSSSNMFGIKKDDLQGSVDDGNLMIEGDE